MRKPPNAVDCAQPPLAAARTAVLEAARRMESPDRQSLEECAVLLENAIAGMNACRSAWPEENAASFQGCRQQQLDEVRRLRQGLLHLRRLLDNAANFYQKWAKRRAALSMGYTAAGEPAEITTAGRMLIRG